MSNIFFGVILYFVHDLSQIQAAHGVQHHVQLLEQNLDTQNTPAERLRSIRGSIPQAEFAKQLGVHKNTLGRYERGESEPDVSTVRAICTNFGVRPEWFIFGEGAMYQDETIRPSSDSKPPCTGQPAGDTEIIFIPRLKARLSAGGGSFEVETECNGKFAFRKDWIRTKGNANDMVLMEVSGDSMEPDICDGDMVLIDQSKNQVIAGGIFAVGVEETIMVKQLDMEPGTLVIRSKNKRYQDIKIPRGSDLAENVRVIGRVIWWCREAR